MKTANPLSKPQTLIAAITAFALILALGGCSGTPDEPAPIPTAPELAASEPVSEPAASEPAPEEAAEPIDWDFYNERAAAFITAAANGDFPEAAAMFDEKMTELFGEDGLRNAWADVIALTGEYIEIHDIQNAENSGYYISGVIMRCENTGFGWNVVFSKDGLIAGLNTGGTIALTAAEQPGEPIRRENATDYPVIIGEGTEYPLNALLSVPAEASGLVPGVVIVAGSGPHNMNGEIYGKTPYRDIAEYLSDNGIAVIRHDKRTYTHAAKFVGELGGKATVREESIEDAILAAKLLKAHPQVDENRVYILGHSLGGVLAPRIHAEGGDFAGLILMAATPRSLCELFIEQTEASVNSGFAEGYINEQERDDALAQTAALAEQFAAIGDMSDEQAMETLITELGVYAYYFKEMDAHPFNEYAKNLAIPVLALQGGRDFQILPDVDFTLIKDIFADNESAVFKLYDNLNHMFMPSEAESFVQHAAEITGKPGAVDAAPLRDIADWIMGG